MTLAMLTEKFCGFIQSIHANVGMLPGIGYYRFLPHPFPFIIHLRSYHPTLYNGDTNNAIK
jgi:hypothetical protein